MEYNGDETDYMEVNTDHLQQVTVYVEGDENDALISLDVEEVAQLHQQLSRWLTKYHYGAGVNIHEWRRTVPRVKVFDAVSDVVVNVKTDVTCPVCGYLGPVEFSALPTDHKTIYEGVFRRRHSVLFGAACEHMTDIWLSETPEDML